MKIIEINSGCYGSTGNIMREIASTSKEEGIEVHLACPDNRNYKTRNILYNWPYKYRISSALNMKISNDLTQLTGLDGCLNWFHTLLLCKYIKKNNIQLIHFHNLHSGYINLPIVFRFIKKNNIPVVWTLHDCWPFTGHCPHFILSKCNKWMIGCNNCKLFKEYPISSYDNSTFMWKLKKKNFQGMSNVMIVTPSNWLKENVQKSFLNKYPVRVINNGIDLSIFKPTDSMFRQEHSIQPDEFIVLGVSFGWGYKKGIDVFVELADRLKHKKIKIVLVGTNENVDKNFPSNIISVHYTQNQTELAQIYTAADLFVNPTREDNYPTVNMESLACGTPVVTFDTGGSCEILDEKCGAVVKCDDIDALESEIIRVFIEKPYKKKACLELAKKFDKNERFVEYCNLYRNML